MTISDTTTSWMMILTLLGIEFLIIETTKLDRPVTIITERPITKAPLSCTVTANEEHIPRIRTVTGLPLKIGFNNVSLSFSFISFPPHYSALAGWSHWVAPSPAALADDR